MKIKAHLFLGGFFLLLSSCGRHNPKNEQYILDYKQQEARNYDIPLVIDFKTESYNSTEPRTLIDGTSMLSIDDIVQFYSIEMERLGWNKVDIFDQDAKKKLIFEKPSKICCIIIAQRRIMFNASQQYISLSVSEKIRLRLSAPSGSASFDGQGARQNNPLRSYRFFQS